MSDLPYDIHDAIGCGAERSEIVGGIREYLVNL